MISSAITKQIALYGHQAPSADNSQPWHFSWDGFSLVITYDVSRVKGKTFPANSQATLLSLGASIENIEIISASYGYRSEYSINIQDLSPRHAKAIIKFQPEKHPTHTTSPHKQPIAKRHTNRFSYHNKALPNSVINHLGNLTKGSARLLFINDKTSILKAGKLVELASNIRFQTREVHEWLGRSLRFTKEDVKKADGLDIRTLDLPPGGSIFLRFISSWNRMKVLNKIGVYRLLAKIDAAPIKVAPAVVAIIAPASPKGAIDAGILMCKAWTYLNNEDIAVHPYYVVADQLARLRENTVPKHLTNSAENIEQQCEATLGLKEGETLHMFLRAGYPKKIPPKSLRLPEELVFTDTSDK